LTKELDWEENHSLSNECVCWWKTVRN